MSTPQKKRGLAELRDASRESRALYWFVVIFSFFVNLLMLTGPTYMLQVYDHVLGSRSEATLIALTMLVAFIRHDGIVGFCPRADHGTRWRQFPSST